MSREPGPKTTTLGASMADSAHEPSSPGGLIIGRVANFIGFETSERKAANLAPRLSVKHCGIV